MDVPWDQQSSTTTIASKVTLKIDEVPDVVAPERRRFLPGGLMDPWNPQKMMDPVEDVQMFGVHVGFSGVYLNAKSGDQKNIQINEYLSRSCL